MRLPDVWVCPRLLAPLKPSWGVEADLGSNSRSPLPTHEKAVLDAGWNVTALCHSALVCGFFNLMNRWVEGLGIEADPKTMDMAGTMLHEKGYNGISELLE